MQLRQFQLIQTTLTSDFLKQQSNLVTLQLHLANIRDSYQKWLGPLLVRPSYLRIGVFSLTNNEASFIALKTYLSKKKSVTQFMARSLHAITLLEAVTVPYELGSIGLRVLCFNSDGEFLTGCDAFVITIQIIVKREYQ